MFEVWVDRERLDLFRDTQVAITKQSLDLAGLVMMKGDYSNSFSIPLTNNNRKILGFADVLNSGNSKAYQALDSRLLIDGAEVLHSARLRIESIGEDIKVSIYSSSVDFYDSIGNKKISELDLSGMDHTLNSTNILGSRTHTATDGYIYPLLDTVLVNPTDYLMGIKEHPSYGMVINMKYMFPCVFVKYLLNKIASEAGYVLEGSLLNDTLFSNTVIIWSGRTDDEKNDVYSRWTTTIEMSKIAPDLSQKDFLKGIAFMFGVILEADFNSKTLHLRRLDDLLSGYLNSKDWSNKLDLKVKPEISFSFEDLAQNNNIKYRTSEGVGDWVKAFGTGSIECKNKNLAISKDIYELPFAVTCGSGEYYTNLNHILYFTQLEYDWYNDAMNWKDDSSVRILYVRRVDNVSHGFRYHSGDLATGTDVTTNIPTCWWHHTGNDSNHPSLGFKMSELEPNPTQTLMIYYYQKMLKIMEYVKVVRCSLNLTISDIYSFSQTSLIWIKYFNSYFFVNKIDRYAGRGSTRVELVKV